MKTTKFHQIYTTLTPKEQNLFLNLILLYYTSDSPMYRMVQELNKGVFDKKELQKKCFKTSIQDVQWRNSISDLKEHLERFLIQKYLEEDKLQSELLKVEMYLKRGLKELGLLKLEALSKNHALESTYWGFYVQVLLFKTKYSHQRKEANNLQELLDTLEQFYALQKLEWSITAHSHSAVTQLHYELLPFSNLTELSTQTPFATNTLLQNFIQAYQLQIHKNEVQYQNFKNTFIQFLEQPLTPHHKTFLMILINFCIQKINQGITTYQNEALEWYQKGLEQHLFQDPYISPHTYKNAISLALNLQYFDLAKKWIEHYAHYLEPHYYNDYHHFTSAKLYYALKNYKEALYYLNALEFQDPFLGLGAKTLLLKIYYEKEDFNALEYLLDSFKSYIKRKKISGFHQKNYLNLMRCTKKLMNTFEPAQKDRLKEDIQKSTPLTEKEWLLEQLQN